MVFTKKRKSKPFVIKIKHLLRLTKVSSQAGAPYFGSGWQGSRLKPLTEADFRRSRGSEAAAQSSRSPNDLPPNISTPVQRSLV